MKRILTALCATVLTLTACDHFHFSDNGDLDGLWQLTQVDTLANGKTTDAREQEIFWAVQANLLEMQKIHQEEQLAIFFHFQLEGDRLTLFDPVADNRAISDSIVTDVSTIWFYGLSHLRETLRVVELNNKRMTLESERLRMYFRKY